jgi:ATP-dependent protease ClpP protease subunit
MTIKFDPGLANKHAVDPRKTLRGENKHTGLGEDLEETFRAPTSASEALPTASSNSAPNAPLQAEAFRSPAIMLFGVIDEAMYENFRDQLAAAADSQLVVIALSTLGGDPEVARMMGEDIRFHSELSPGRRFVFLGKTAIYSAGITFMSFFARQNRYVTRGSRLMIHERKLSKTLAIDGPLTMCLANVRATLNEIECSIAIQNEGFENLVRGSQVSIEQVLEKAPNNWYIEAKDAKKFGLIADVV